MAEKKEIAPPALPAQLPGLLLDWFAVNARSLPWRRDREPYHVWLSEIMLQQTRVQAVLGYYARFLQALPDIPALAACPEDRLLKLWEGLGYYSRVRNLQKAARVICEEYGGVFPADYRAIRALPGIGDYTAGAIASICFEQPRAAVDGNVLRVITRLTGDDTPVEQPAFRKAVAAALEALYPAGQCGAFTQALMELGALVCVPNGAPLCHRCPLAGLCRAKAEGRTGALPVKGAKKPRRKEQLTVLLLWCGDKLALCRRPESGLLAGLWQLPNLPGELTVEQALAQAAEWGAEPHHPETVVHRSHIFTHVEWEMTGISIRCNREAEGFAWADREERAGEYALPTAFRQFLEE